MTQKQRFFQGLHKPLQLCKKLKPIWIDKNISLGSKVKEMRSLTISIFLYVCEKWTLPAELEKSRRAFWWDATEGYWTFRIKTMLSIKRFAKRSKQLLENIKWAPDHRQETEVFLSRLKVFWVSKTILQGIVKGKRRKGRQKKRWKTILRSG